MYLFRELPVYIVTPARELRLEFITRQVTTIKDVLTVESFIVYEGYNLKVPYIL